MAWDQTSRQIKFQSKESQYQKTSHFFCTRPSSTPRHLKFQPCAPPAGHHQSHLAIVRQNWEDPFLYDHATSSAGAIGIGDFGTRPSNIYYIYILYIGKGFGFIMTNQAESKATPTPKMQFSILKHLSSGHSIPKGC